MQRRIEAQIKCPKTDKYIFVKNCAWCEHFMKSEKLRQNFEVYCNYKN